MRVNPGFFVRNELVYHGIPSVALWKILVRVGEWLKESTPPILSPVFVANTPLDRKINGLGGPSLASPFSRRSVLQT
jgi:hypothetical protein